MVIVCCGVTHPEVTYAGGDQVSWSFFFCLWKVGRRTTHVIIIPSLGWPHCGILLQDYVLNSVNHFLGRALLKVWNSTSLNTALNERRNRTCALIWGLNCFVILLKLVKTICQLNDQTMSGLNYFSKRQQECAPTVNGNRGPTVNLQVNSWVEGRKSSQLERAGDEDSIGRVDWWLYGLPFQVAGYLY